MLPNTIISNATTNPAHNYSFSGTNYNDNVSINTNPNQWFFETLQKHQHQQIQKFWCQQMEEVEQTTDLKQHQLPLSRIKKIMKSDEEVKMISAETPLFFAKACELFILELTLRSWMQADSNDRRTVHRDDVASAIRSSGIFDFLTDVVPLQEAEETTSMPMAGSNGQMGASMIDTSLDQLLHYNLMPTTDSNPAPKGRFL